MSFIKSPLEPEDADPQQLRGLIQEQLMAFRHVLFQQRTRLKVEYGVALLVIWGSYLLPLLGLIILARYQHVTIWFAATILTLFVTAWIFITRLLIRQYHLDLTLIQDALENLIRLETQIQAESRVPHLQFLLTQIEDSWHDYQFAVQQRTYREEDDV